MIEFIENNKKIIDKLPKILILEVYIIIKK